MAISAALARRWQLLGCGNVPVSHSHRSRFAFPGMLCRSISPSMTENPQRSKRTFHGGMRRLASISTGFRRFSAADSTVEFGDRFPIIGPCGLFAGPERRRKVADCSSAIGGACALTPLLSVVSRETTPIVRAMSERDVSAHHLDG